MKLTILNKRIGFVCIFVCISILMYGIIGIVNKNNKSLQVNSTPITNKTIVIDAGHGKPDERNSLLTLKNNIDLLQKIKCFKHFIFFMLKRRLIYAKQRIW